MVILSFIRKGFLVYYSLLFWCTKVKEVFLKYKYAIQINISNITIQVTSPTVPPTPPVTVTAPFTVTHGDTLSITIIKKDVLNSAYITLKGTLS